MSSDSAILQHQHDVCKRVNVDSGVTRGGAGEGRTAPGDTFQGEVTPG